MLSHGALAPDQRETILASPWGWRAWDAGHWKDRTDTTSEIREVIQNSWHLWSLTTTQETFARLLDDALRHHLGQLITAAQSALTATAGRVTLVQGDEEVAAGIRFELTPGHTPGHTMVIDERTHPLLETYVKEVLTRFADDDRILAWDLYNEPTNGGLAFRSMPLLRKGVPYREIHDLTGVSVTTIGRVARSLEHGAGGYAVAIERIAARKTESN